MKKCWTRIKHWLIRKLGGYVAQPVKQIVYTVKNPIKLCAERRVDAYTWRNRENPIGGIVVERLMDDIREDLTKAICNNVDIVDIKCCEDFVNDMVTIKAEVLVCPRR